MNSRKREAVFMGIGILAGLALSGPAAQAATTISATLSSQPIYVDGQRAAMTAYSIGGNNKALWGGWFPRWWLEQQPGYTLNTRYPE